MHYPIHIILIIIIIVIVIIIIACILQIPFHLHTHVGWNPAIWISPIGLGALARAISLDITKAALAKCEIRKREKIRRRVSVG